MHVAKTLRPWSVFAVGLLFCTHAVASENAHAGAHGAPTVNWWTWSASAPPVGWFLLDFVLFVALLVYFTRKPIKAAFMARHLRIKKALGDAEGALKGAKDRYEEYRGKLADVDHEAAQHVERGKVDGKTEQEAILAAARTYVERLKADAKAVIASEGQRARERLQRQVVDDLLKRTEALLITGLGPQERERLLEESIGALEMAPTEVLGQQGKRDTGAQRGGAA